VVVRFMATLVSKPRCVALHLRICVDRNPRSGIEYDVSKSSRSQVQVSRCGTDTSVGRLEMCVTGHALAARWLGAAIHELNVDMIDQNLAYTNTSFNRG
jgi:hypothetical protein